MQGANDGVTPRVARDGDRLGMVAGRLLQRVDRSPGRCGGAAVAGSVVRAGDLASGDGQGGHCYVFELGGELRGQDGGTDLSGRQGLGGDHVVGEVFDRRRDPVRAREPGEGKAARGVPGR